MSEGHEKPTTEEKVARRRERNKELARKSRVKKKEELESLAVAVELLVKENGSLREQLGKMKDVVVSICQQYQVSPPPLVAPFVLTTVPCSPDHEAKDTPTPAPAPRCRRDLGKVGATTAVAVVVCSQLEVDAACVLAELVQGGVVATHKRLTPLPSPCSRSPPAGLARPAKRARSSGPPSPCPSPSPSPSPPVPLHASVSVVPSAPSPQRRVCHGTGHGDKGEREGCWAVRGGGVGA